MIVYVIKSPAGIEGVWTTPEAALKARGQSGSRAQIVVRGTDLAEDTDEVKATRQELREMRDRIRERDLAKQIEQYRADLSRHAPGFAQLASDLLKVLADDPAGTLEAEGIRGTKSSTNDPVHKYLMANLPRPMGTQWVVSRTTATFMHGIHALVWVELPDEVVRFIEMFDRGEFPNLVDTGATT